MKNYREDWKALPTTRLTWPLYGSGLENFGSDGKPVEMPMPQPGPDELLARIDAAGLCFSDIKVLNLGNQHPRIFGRDMAKNPVIPGHECALTVMTVGENWKDKFKPGDRFIVQADVYFNGKNIAFGYALPGALEQYVVIGKEMLDGDEGCYLLPLKETTGYAEAALSEPWACVVASYLYKHRTSIKADGVLWVIGGAGASDSLRVSKGLDAESHPRTMVLTDVPEGLSDRLEKQAKAAGCNVVRTASFESLDLDTLSQEQTGGARFDDVVLLAATAAQVEKVEPLIASHGVLSVVGKGSGD
ncbi:MAG TPA: alcohol dehydrogenase catalytic domain-containing protein, partial [Armatimonadota bacterium]|nr:alcohol dehydrogenase catalytic domain-containing protein [Armatimonadota bacterium]